MCLGMGASEDMSVMTCLCLFTNVCLEGVAVELRYKENFHLY